MATLTFTVKNIYGDPIQGASVEITPRMPQSGLGGTKTTNAEGKATFEYNSVPTSRYTIIFSKDGYNTKVLEQPSGLPLYREFKLYEDIIKFKLYKYNENAHTEELYTGNIRVEQYTYDSGSVAAPSTINPISISNDGYYHIAYENVYPIVQTNTYLFKLTANDLTNYGSIFLLPNGFITKQVTNWSINPYKIHIVYNSLPEQIMVFYPNTKRLTKAELRRCVVSNPHLMKDGKDESYCPTNFTYSTTYNMIKDSNNRDNNYISGAEDINFYQNKTLTIANDSSSKHAIRCYINAPGKTQMENRLIVPGKNNEQKIYYSADVQVKAVSEDNNYVVSPSLQTTTMNDSKTITFTCKERTFTYIIEKIELILDTAASNPTEWAIAKITGSWKNNEAPNTLETLKVAVTIYDPEANGYLSFKDTLPNCNSNNGTYQIVQNRKYNSIDNYESTGNGIVHTNGNSFYVVSIFFSSTNIYYQFKNNGYYSGGVFRPHVIPEPTNTPSQPGGGSSWGGGQYTVHVNPNGKSVECDLEDNIGNKKHETITSGKTYNVEQLAVVGDGLWKYASTESGVIGSPDSNTFYIPNPQDSAGRHIELTLVQQEW